MNSSSHPSPSPSPCRLSPSLSFMDEASRHPSSRHLITLNPRTPWVEDTRREQITHTTAGIRRIRAAITSVECSSSGGTYTHSLKNERLPPRTHVTTSRGSVGLSSSSLSLSLSLLPPCLFPAFSRPGKFQFFSLLHLHLLLLHPLLLFHLSFRSYLPSSRRSLSSM